MSEIWPWRRYLRFGALAAALTLLLIAAGWIPTRRFGGPEATAALLAGSVISLVAAALGGLGALIAGRRHSQPVVVAFTAMGLRLAILAILGVIAVGSGLFPPIPLLLWIGVSYLVLLALETRYVLGATEAAAHAVTKTTDVNDTLEKP